MSLGSIIMRNPVTLPEGSLDAMLSDFISAGNAGQVIVVEKQPEPKIERIPFRGKSYELKCPENQYPD